MTHKYISVESPWKIDIGKGSNTLDSDDRTQAKEGDMESWSGIEYIYTIDLNSNTLLCDPTFHNYAFLRVDTNIPGPVLLDSFVDDWITDYCNLTSTTTDSTTFAILTALDDINYIKTVASKTPVTLKHICVAERVKKFWGLDGNVLEWLKQQVEEKLRDPKLIESLKWYDI